jgi:hypothetical protein
MPRRSFAVVIAVAAAMLAACQGGATTGSDGFVNSPAGPTVSPVELATDLPSPTPPAVPEQPPATRGDAGATCIEGWRTPQAGSPDAREPIRWIRQASPFEGEAVIVDMRMFIGGESPPSDKNYLEGIRRWYVKLYAAEDFSYQGRFLVEERRFGTGVAAVAPYDTAGFASPDWIGFQYEVGAEPEAYDGLPGRWNGLPYDFVGGGAGLTLPGLPADVAGCLDGT